MADDITARIVGVDSLPNVYTTRLQLVLEKIIDPYGGGVTNWKYKNIFVKGCVYDVKELYNGVEQSYWLEHKLFQGFMNTKCYLIVATDNGIAPIINGETDLPEFVKNFNSDNPSSPELYKIFEADPKTYLSGVELVNNKVEFKFQFDDFLTLPGPIRPHNIYIFLQNCINLEDLKSTYGLDFDFTPNQWYMGPLKGEQLTKNGQKNENTSIFFVDEDQLEPFAGPAHKTEGVYEAGAFHTAEPHPRLYERRVAANTKLHFYTGQALGQEYEEADDDADDAFGGGGGSTQEGDQGDASSGDQSGGGSASE